MITRAEKIFTPEIRKQVKDAIRKAEDITSGEIRVYVEDRCLEDVLDHSAFIFSQMKMHKTKLRNGVLFYLAIEDHKLAVLGDAGINSKVEEGFWRTVQERMVKKFTENEFSAGLVEGIKIVSEVLAKFFPPGVKDINELPDDIAFGNEKK
ncbi:MAG: TPM domain-containing protein [Bacteroidia bacterium]